MKTASQELYSNATNLAFHPFVRPDKIVVLPEDKKY